MCGREDICVAGLAVVQVVALGAAVGAVLALSIIVLEEGRVAFSTTSRALTLQTVIRALIADGCAQVYVMLVVAYAGVAALEIGLGSGVALV